MENDNLIVYKYRNWKDQRHKDVLQKNELFFCSPSTFNDPFDGTIPICFSLLNTDEKISNFAKNWLNSNRLKKEINVRTFNEDYEELTYLLKNDIEKFQSKYSKIEIDNSNRRLGFLSLSKSWNTTLMWTNYSDNHLGYCMGVYGEKIRKYISGGGGPVFYNSEYPLFEPIMDNDKSKSYDRFHCKSNDWKYEEEYRLSKVFYPEEPTEYDRKIVIPDEFLSDVTIGLKLDIKEEEEIIEEARKKRIKVYKAIQVPFKFQLDRVEIK